MVQNPPQGKEAHEVSSKDTHPQEPPCEAHEWSAKTVNQVVLALVELVLCSGTKAKLQMAVHLTDK